MNPASLLPLFQDAVGQITGDWLLYQAILFLSIAARLGGLVIAMPRLINGLPIRMRVLLVILMTIVVMPGVSASSSIGGSFSALEVVFAAGREVVLGMMIGGIVQLLMTGVGLAGELIANATGMQLAQTADPSTGESVHQFSKLLSLLVTAILFTVGGHRLLIDAILSSFRKIPPLTVSVDQTMLALLIDHLSIGIESGLRVAAPIVGCVLLTNLVVALVSRTVPQLNVLAIGLNINVMAALVVIALSIGSAGLVFETELAGAIERLGLAGGALGGGTTADGTTADGTTADGTLVGP